jgi:hypothetical protein
MIALFNKNSDLVAWLSEDRLHIFDTNMNWIAFVADNSTVWNVENLRWIGHLYGYNIRDFNGLTLFWNPETPIENTSKPITPFKPFKPFQPFKPIKPFNPFRPFKPFEPIGGWSPLTINDFIHG